MDNFQLIKFEHHCIVKFQIDKPINTFNPNETSLLQVEKRSLEDKLTRTRSINPKNYKNMTNFSQLVKGPETILTIANDWTLFNRNAYLDAKMNKKDYHERINDIKSPLNKIPTDLLPHFSVKELMGPPELIPTYKEAYRRDFIHPLNRIPKIEFYNIDTLDAPIVNFTPNRSQRVKRKIIELQSPNNQQLVTTIKKKIDFQDKTGTPQKEQKEVNNMITNLTKPSPLISPTKARLQQKLQSRQSPTVLPVKQKTQPIKSNTTTITIKQPETKIDVEIKQKDETNKRRLEEQKKVIETKERKEKDEKLKEKAKKVKPQNITSDQQNQLYLKMKGDLTKQLTKNQMVKLL